MDFKKCSRCGCFFLSNGSVCCNCASKDSYDLARLNSFLSENSNINSTEELSYNTGISLKTINRLVDNKNIDFPFRDN